MFFFFCGLTVNPFIHLEECSLRYTVEDNPVGKAKEENPLLWPSPSMEAVNIGPVCIG
jgi:hypothetical protein